MKKCSLLGTLEIVRGDINDYRSLARFHYRGGRLGPYEKIFAIRDSTLRGGSLAKTIGVIVYAMPCVASELRNIATNGEYLGIGDRSLRMQLINKDIRCISRVIIEPRYCGLGLASWLVKETIPMAGVKYIEAMAVMGKVNPFFEKAGMKKFEGKLPRRCVQLASAFSVVGIEGKILAEPASVLEKIGSLKREQKEFVRSQVQHFLQSYGRSGKRLKGLEQIRFVLSKLESRPIYYLKTVSR